MTTGAGRRPDGPARRGGDAARRLGAAAAAVVVAVALGACSNSGEEDTAEEHAPSTLTQVGDVMQVTLTEDAAGRLEVETARTRSMAGQTVVPYAALIYDGDGASWVYTVAEPLSYLRKPVVIDSIEGDQVRLSSGLPPGVDVLTVGASEVYGSELGIEGDH